MSPLTIFLAKLLGLYCVIIALAMAARKESVTAAVDTWVRNAALMLLTGAITIAMGLAMIIGHNVWSGGPLPLVVTLIGWLTLAKGLMFLALPGRRALKLYEALQYEKLFFVYMGATLVLGLYLTIAAFIAD